MTGLRSCEALKHGPDPESLILYRGRTHFIILNRFPYNPGHLMSRLTGIRAAFERTSPPPRPEQLADVESRHPEYRARSPPRRGFRNVAHGPAGRPRAGVTEHYHLHVVPRDGRRRIFMPLMASDQGGHRGSEYDLRTHPSPCSRKRRKRINPTPSGKTMLKTMRKNVKARSPTLWIIIGYVRNPDLSPSGEAPAAWAKPTGPTPW